MRRLAAILAVLVIALAAAPATVAHHQGAAGAAGGGVQGDGSRIALGTPVRTSASPSPCSDSAYAFLGPKAAWGSTLSWRFNSSLVPKGLKTKKVLKVIKRSFANVTKGRNDCGRSDKISAKHKYLGKTTRQPNISKSGACGSPDGTSTVGFGSLGGYYAGYTCAWWNGAKRIYEMDMRLDPNQAWALKVKKCRNALMLEALVTHEVGHAFGLTHVGEAKHGRLTMSVYIDGLCQKQEATLGRGDLLGLEALY